MILELYNVPPTWPETKAEAYKIEEWLAKLVVHEANLEPPSTIAAIDTAYGHGAEIVYAAAVVFTFPEIRELERAFFYTQVRFPYVPGLYYFREGPAILKALEKLESEPDVLMVHGHGSAHPRQCGMASLIGASFDKPSVGCARQRLAGYVREPGPERGSHQPIMLGDKRVGTAYRTKNNVKPIYISPGHRMSLELAQEIVVKNLRGYRLPEPLRMAHRLANRFRRQRERKLGIRGKKGNP
jgi:deoxyribonuclease V